MRARLLLLTLLSCFFVSPAPAQVFQPESFTLENGLQVVVITNRRAPIVVQMIYYKVGAADEEPGKSGLAHFLEHLMFKGTSQAAAGEFSAVVARSGGTENAFTTRDYTAFWQMVAKESLETMMRYEADRMSNLVLTDEVVLAERDVILEERRQRFDNEARGRLDERVMTALFANNAYGRPTIGWMHEMAGLTTDDALAFYQRWYAPNNAILLLSGDIDAAEARPLVEKYYGPLVAKEIPERHRLREPPPWAARRVSVSDATVQQERLTITYQVPQRADFKANDEEALQILVEIMGGGSDSRLTRALVVDGIASSAGVTGRLGALDYGSLHFYVVPREGVSLDAVETKLLAENRHLLSAGVTDAEVADARNRLLDGAIFARDDPESAPRILGAVLAVGGTLEEAEAWPQHLVAVTAAQINGLVQQLLIPENSVTGLLQKAQP